MSTGTWKRRLMAAAVAASVVLPTGCVSGRGGSGGAWMAGMMGVMVVGGVLLGTGTMHGAEASMHRDTVFLTERFEPARLLEQRALLELSDEQVAALEALRADVAQGQRSAEAAARAAYELLRRVQRAAASPGAPGHDGRRIHH